MSKENIKKVLDAIRSRLADEHITQRELARLIHVDPSTLSHKLTGQNQLKLNEIDAIAIILHCSAADLVAGKTADEANAKPDAYTVDQVAQLLGRSRDQVLDLIQTGHLEAIQPVKAYLITRRSYEKFVSKK